MKRRGFRTRREAQAALVELLGDVQHGSFVEPTTITVGEWLTRWCDGLPSAGLRPRTSASYRDIVTGLVVPRLGAGRLQALAPSDFNRLYAGLLAEGRRPDAG